MALARDLSFDSGCIASWRSQRGVHAGICLGLQYVLEGELY